MPGKVVRPPFVPFMVPVHGSRKPRYFVFHTTEGTGTIETLAHYFLTNGNEYGVNYITEPNGRMGSLGNFLAYTWHVGKENAACIGCEQIGTYLTSNVGWFRKIRQLWAACWIAAWVSQELEIPLRLAAKDHVYIQPSGFCQHRDLPNNNHLDCGDGYPFDWVLGIAAKWKANGVPIWVRAALPKK